MGKSYIIKYVGQIDNGETTQQLYRMRLQDFIGDFNFGKKQGLKKDTRIKVYKQTSGKYIYDIVIKKDIPIFEQDAGLHFINLPQGIEWHNYWIISKKYYSLEKIFN